MFVTTFIDERDNAPRTIPITWGGLAEAIAKPRTAGCSVDTCTGKNCPHKKGVPCWSPVRYRDGATRGIAGVLDVHAMVLDIDDASDSTLQNALRIIDNRGLKCIVHASHSDRPNARRVRVILPLEVPILAADWPAFWRAAVDDLQIPVDPSTKDASRLYFMPSRPRGADYLCGAYDGKSYSVNYTTPSITPQPPSIAPDVDRTSLTLAAAKIAKHFPDRGRHDAFVALAGALAKSGWEVDAIAEFTHAVARLVPGLSDDRVSGKLSRYEATTTAAKVARGESVKGWSGLEFLPADAQTYVQDKLAITVKDFDWAAQTPGVIELLGVAPSVAQSRWVGDLALIEYPPVRSFATGIAEFDIATGGGISTQQVTAVLGPPSGGKSALVISWALKIENVVPVLYCSTELGHNEIVARMAAPSLDVAWRDIVRGSAATVDGPVTSATCHAALKAKRIAVIGQDELYKAGDKAVEVIARAALAIKEECGVMPLIFVDYMQELARGDSAQVRMRTTAVAVAFRQISQALDTAVILVCSVGRAGYSGDDGKRDLDDPTSYKALAKESGDIDFIAAAIIYVDLAVQAESDGWRLGRIALAKNRHGEACFAGVKFRGATGVFESAPNAAASMSAGERAVQRDQKQHDVYETRIMAKVRELACYAKIAGEATKLMSKGELVSAVSGNNAQKGATVDRLIREGKIVEISEKYNDAVGAMKTRKVISLVETGAPAVKDLEPISVGDVLAGIVGASKA